MRSAQLNEKDQGQTDQSAYRVAHFSDFHLSKVGVEFERALALVQDAIQNRVDHIVITGDIVDAAQIEVVRSFWTRLRRWGWVSSEKLTFAPGNHDIFPTVKRWPFLSGLARPTTNYRKLCNLTQSSRRGECTWELASPYPVGKVIAPTIAIAVLDTTRNRQYSPLKWAEGELPEKDRQAVSAFFSRHRNKAHRIIAMHHTPFPVESENSWFNMNFTEPTVEDVQQWLRDCGATLVLCGHIHCSVQLEKLWPKCWVLQAGTAGGYDEDEALDDAIRTYHIIECSPNGRVKFITRSFKGDKLD